jgi:hypothetical protein
MGKAMKLLLAILLFAGIADANAQNTVVHSDTGAAWVLQADMVQQDPEYTAGAYNLPDGLSIYVAATGCSAGRGVLRAKPLTPEYKGKPFHTTDWSYKGLSFRDRLAIALCAEGISK